MTVIPPPPPELAQMRAGARLVAGLTWSTVLPDLDFETYSEAGYVWSEQGQKWVCLPNAPQEKKGLGVVGLDVYARHPSTVVLSLSYDLKDGRGRRWWRPGLPQPLDLLLHVVDSGLLEAWNAAFEAAIWEHVCRRLYGWPELRLDQMRCAMAKARAHGLAGALEVTGEVLQIEHQKDPEGDRLLKKFSVPRNPTKKDARRRIDPAEDAEDGPRLYAYNDRDILAEAECSALVPDLSAAELRHWFNDQRINRRGVAVDLPSVDACIAIVEQAMRRYGEEMRDLTGGIKPSEVQQLRGWFAGRGIYLDDLDAETCDRLLDDLPKGSTERRVVEIRSAVSSASVKKVFALKLRTGPDGRLRHLYAFHAARTGRPTSVGVQAANLPKAGPNVYRCAGCRHYFGEHLVRCPWCSALRGPGKPDEWSAGAAEDALTVIAGRSLDLLQQFFGDAMLTIAGCLRGLFIAGQGMRLVSSDFTAIEGVVIACLAGEQWRVDAYRNDAPMYLLSAERMFGVSVAEMQAYAKANGRHHPLRQKGKGGELGLGFGGWINALRQFGVDGADDELKETVVKWRAASPALVEFWGGQTRGLPWDDNCRPELYGLEGAAVAAMHSPNRWIEVRQLSGDPTGVAYQKRGDVLYCRVPSGGLLTYHRPRLSRSTRPHAREWEFELSFEGWNTNAKKGAAGWMRMKLYGGLLAENVTQRTARDVQMPAIDRCEHGGYPVVLHTYDEIVSEVPDWCGSVPELEGLMCAVEPWAAGWPIKAAGGWEGPRYCKA